MLPSFVFKFNTSELCRHSLETTVFFVPRQRIVNNVLNLFRRGRICQKQHLFILSNPRRLSFRSAKQIISSTIKDFTQLANRRAAKIKLSKLIF